MALGGAALVVVNSVKCARNRKYEVLVMCFIMPPVTAYHPPGSSGGGFSGHATVRWTWMAKGFR